VSPAHFRFCAGFFRAGVFNFGTVGETHEVDDEGARAKDRRRGNQIIVYAAMIGALVAIVAASWVETDPQTCDLRHVLH
jgi:hypothetical protein